MAEVPPVVYVSAEQILFDHARDLVDAAAAGVQDAVSLLNRPPEVQVLPSQWDDGPYGSVAWFVDRATFENPDSPAGQQVLWNRLLTDLTNDPARSRVPHLGYMLLAMDMNVAIGSDFKLQNFIFGATEEGIGQSVQSVGRFILADTEVSDLTLVTRHVARHEVGHLLGLDRNTIRNQSSGGLFVDGHCANVCTMQQHLSVPTAIAAARQLQHASNAGFCADCTGYLRRR